MTKKMLVTALFFSCVLFPLGVAGAGEAYPATGTVEPAEGATPAEATVPHEIHAAIEDALRDKVNGLLKEKNDEGASTKRGTYSKDFRRIDDATYQVTFHVDSADERRMQTQRFLLTLKPDPSRSHAWKIANEELQDACNDFYRSAVKDTSFHRFESFSFDHEGLKVSGSKGSLYEEISNGKLQGFTLSAPDLVYTYVPPMGLHQKLWEKMKRDHAGDVIFRPGYLSVNCDPTSCEQLLQTGVKGLVDSSREGIDPALRSYYDSTVSDYKDNLKEDYFRFFRPAPEPDNRYWFLEIGKSFFKPRSPATAISLSYDNFQPWEVRFSAYGLNSTFPFWSTLYGYYSEDTRKSGVSPLELERRPDYGSRNYDLESIRGSVDLAVEESETMTGDLTFRMKTKRSLARLLFEIARLRREREDTAETKNPRMFVNSIQDGEGHELTFVKLGATRGIVLLPKPIPADTWLTVRMRFTNKDVIYKETPSYSYLDRGGWLPFVHFGDMIHDFDLTVRVPAQYTTLGIGKKISDEVKDGVRITRWVPDMPVDFPTIIFGQYVEAESSVKAVKIDGTPIPVKIHVDNVSMGDYEISPKSLQVFADEAANALNLYRTIYGVDYPYSKLDLVNDPVPFLYGQSPSSIVYLGSPTFKKALLANFGGANLTKFVKSLVAHETAHQWWGSLIGNANFRNYWFVESLAEYSAALFVENVHSRQEYLEHVEDWRREILESDMEVSVQDASELWGGDDGFRTYRAAVYSKGPYAFYIMRSIWGDEKFFVFLKMLAQELAGKEIVTRDIQKVAEKAFGGNMEWFFDQWLRGVGLPEFKFTSSVRQTEDGKYLVEGEVDQRLLLGKKKEVFEGQYFRGVVPITMKGGSGKEFQYKLLVDGPKTPFKFKVAEKPVEIVFNKYGEALAWDVVGPGTW